MSRNSFTLRMAVLAFLIMPAASQAQTAVKSSIRGDTYAKALELRAQAVALYSQPKRAAEAARLHVQEASHRSVRDPEAVEALVMVGRLFNYANRAFDARKVMEQAGERALAMGDIARAANAYLDAAFIARAGKLDSEVARLARRAYLLTDSPLLSMHQRNEIRKRFANEPSFAQAIR